MMKFPKLDERRAALQAIFDAAGPDQDIKKVPAAMFGDHPHGTVRERISSIKSMNDELAATVEVGRQAEHAMNRGDGELGAEGGYSGAGGASFYEAIVKAGFDRRTRSHVSVPLNAVTFTGDVGGAERIRKESPGLGADQRFLYPSLRLENVGRETTGIESYKQTARAPASPSDMVRAIAAVTAKPETGTTVEVVAAALKQIATVSTGIPNVLLESSSFRSFVESDLRFAYSSAIDYHCVSQITASTPTEGSPGANILEAIIHAAEVVAAAGYSPSILAMAPQDLISLLLLTEQTSADYVGSAMDHALAGLTKVAVAGLAVPLVLDPLSLGCFYSSPVSFMAFEENAGATNSATVRVESNGLFVVQRADAVAAVAIPEVSA